MFGNQAINGISSRTFPLWGVIFKTELGEGLTADCKLQKAPRRIEIESAKMELEILLSASLLSPPISRSTLPNFAEVHQSHFSPSIYSVM